MYICVCLLSNHNPLTLYPPPYTHIGLKDIKAVVKTIPYEAPLARWTAGEDRALLQRRVQLGYGDNAKVGWEGHWQVSDMVSAVPGRNRDQVVARCAKLFVYSWFKLSKSCVCN